MDGHRRKNRVPERRSLRFSIQRLENLRYFNTLTRQDYFSGASVPTMIRPRFGGGMEYDDMEEKNPIQVADRLFGALELLAEHGAMGLMEISERLDLNKSTARRILTSLMYLGYVRQSSRNEKYELSMKLVKLSSQLLERRNLPRTVRPYLRRLMELTGETVHLVERDGTEVVYIDKVESYANSIQMVSRIGSRLPVYCSGVGKAIAAELPAREVEEIWRGSSIESRTEHTITDYGIFLENLEEVRRLGYALDREENETGVVCVAASLKDYLGRTAYAFSISAPVGRMPKERIRELAEYVLALRKEMQEAIEN